MKSHWRVDLLLHDPTQAVTVRSPFGATVVLAGNRGGPEILFVQNFYPLGVRGSKSFRLCLPSPVPHRRPDLWQRGAAEVSGNYGGVGWFWAVPRRQGLLQRRPLLRAAPRSGALGFTAPTLHSATCDGFAGQDASRCVSSMDSPARASTSSSASSVKAPRRLLGLSELLQLQPSFLLPFH
jgi:hypothetical protein